MPFGIHPIAFVFVLAAALLIFGPKKLPELSRSIGQSIQSFKKSMDDGKDKHDEAQPKEAEMSQPRSLDTARLELDLLERDLVSKKAAVAAQEAARPTFD
jgi:sec-independent protein translocase protein TatA